MKWTDSKWADPKKYPWCITYDGMAPGSAGVGETNECAALESDLLFKTEAEALSKAIELHQEEIKDLQSQIDEWQKSLRALNGATG